MIPPRAALFGAQAWRPALPVCDHYAGTPQRMLKALQMQADECNPTGPRFDVTLDNEDGAAVGEERTQAQRIAALLGSVHNRWGRVGVRLLPVSHPQFSAVASEVLRAARAPAYLMLPKPEGLACVQQAAHALDALGAAAVPLHALIETHGALRDVFAIAAHPRIESLSFGLMDFVSAHGGAIPASAMGAAGQFEHPLVMRAKLEISAACHARAKTPSHNVVTEFKDVGALRVAAQAACRRLGYTRMWSIHPAQIVPIVQAFAPDEDELAEAIEIIVAAQAAQWAPTRRRDTLHDRASYRYHWQVIERAQRAAPSHVASHLPAPLRERWFGPLSAA